MLSAELWLGKTGKSWLGSWETGRDFWQWFARMVFMLQEFILHWTSNILWFKYISFPSSFTKLI